MKLTIAAVVLLAAFVVGWLILKLLRRQPSGTARWPFYARKPLTQSEQVLYHRLVRALPDHIILAQVQVSRVLGVKKGFSFHEWNNRINRLSYDFVVCAKDSTVIAAIELDDKTHEKASRARTDEKKNKATEDAGLRLIRWKAGALPGDDEIRAELLALLPSAASTGRTANRAGAASPRIEPTLR